MSKSDSDLKTEWIQSCHIHGPSFQNLKDHSTHTPEKSVFLALLALIKFLVRFQSRGIWPSKTENALLFDTLSKIAILSFNFTELDTYIHPLYRDDVLHLPMPHPSYSGVSWYKMLPERILYDSYEPTRPSIGKTRVIYYVWIVSSLEGSGIRLTFNIGNCEDIAQGDLNKEFLQGFLKRHPNLEALNLDDLGAPVLTSNMLLRCLRLLSFYWCGEVGENGDNVEMLENMPDLRSCRLEIIDDLERFVQLVPNLERLDYFAEGTPLHVTAFENSFYPFGRKDKTKKFLLSQINELVKLQRLTHLSRFFSCTGIYPDLKTELKLLQIVVDLIPTFKYVEIFNLEWDRVWVKIERDAHGMYRGYLEIKSLDNSDWWWSQYALAFLEQ
ncbi:hypothetical protein M422DRAFT_51812 [Sphaerobolus stellatus SS14]|uniref:Uncharacterized protein n=1 Tax=Sphaerobolus stellatus (strain SS14) TaxID=990650 RepID=A0A0C9TWW1_SPHS4|nr:hypothetical protein M422DRAFT_51812 [Sphaerobolus stellatus SS14]